MLDTRSLTPPVVTQPVEENCVGAWSVCEDGCADKVYLITTAVSGNGLRCPTAHGGTAPCAPGEGACVTAVITVCPTGLPPPCDAAPPPTAVATPYDSPWCQDSPVQRCQGGQRACDDPQCPVVGQCGTRTDSLCCEFTCADPTPGLPPPPPNAITPCPAGSNYLENSGTMAHGVAAGADALADGQTVSWCLRCTTPGEVVQLTFSGAI